MNLLPPRNAARPGDDPIFALNREATERRAAGERVINATVGALLEDDGALAVLPTVLAALRDTPGAKAAGYAPIAGPADFHRAVIDDLLGGTALAAQAVAAATPGGTGALRHALSVFLDPGQAMLTSDFFWGPYATLCEENNRTLKTFPMFTDGLGFNVEGFVQALHDLADTQGRLLVFLNDPCHNPTGYSMSEAEWTAVASALRAVSARVPTAILADVAYLAYGRDTRSFLRHLAPLAEQAVVLFAWSGSKAFSLYGGRVGALVACTADASERGAIARAMSFACRGVWSNCNAAGMHAVTRCLSEPALREAVASERGRLRDLLAARVVAFNAAAAGTGLRYPRYDGGFFVTVFARDAKAAGEALKARGVFVVPQPGALRVALCSVAEADVPALVEALAAVV